MSQLKLCDACGGKDEGCVVALMLAGTAIPGCESWRPDGSVGIEDEMSVRIEKTIGEEI